MKSMGNVVGLDRVPGKLLKSVATLEVVKTDELNLPQVNVKCGSPHPEWL